MWVTGVQMCALPISLLYGQICHDSLGTTTYMAVTSGEGREEAEDAFPWWPSSNRASESEGAPLKDPLQGESSAEGTSKPQLESDDYTSKPGLTSETKEGSIIELVDDGDGEDMEDALDDAALGDELGLVDPLVSSNAEDAQQLQLEEAEEEQDVQMVEDDDDEVQRVLDEQQEADLEAEALQALEAAARSAMLPEDGAIIDCTLDADEAQEEEGCVGLDTTLSEDVFNEGDDPCPQDPLVDIEVEGVDDDNAEEGELLEAALTDMAEPADDPEVLAHDAAPEDLEEPAVEVQETSIEANDTAYPEVEVEEDIEDESGTAAEVTQLQMLEALASAAETEGVQQPATPPITAEALKSVELKEDEGDPGDDWFAEAEDEVENGVGEKRKAGQASQPNKRARKCDAYTVIDDEGCLDVDQDDDAVEDPFEEQEEDAVDDAVDDAAVAAQDEELPVECEEDEVISLEEAAALEAHHADDNDDDDELEAIC